MQPRRNAVTAELATALPEAKKARDDNEETSPKASQVKTVATSMARQVRVLYHYPCIDGVCAALATYLAFRDKPELGKRACSFPLILRTHLSRHPVDSSLDFQASGVGKCEFPHAAGGSISVSASHNYSNLLSLDYCGPASFIPDIAKRVQKVTLIDHHKTAVEIVAALREKNQLPSNGTVVPLLLLLTEAVEINLEMDYSGASLALKYFHLTIADEGLKKWRAFFTQVFSEC